MSIDDKYFFLMSIGPVKSFINDSRKAQDLFAGSSLLSNMCKDAIVLASEKFDNNFFELITPAVIINNDFKNNTSPSIPNRFLVSVKGDIEQLKKVAREIEKEIKADFSTIPGFNDDDLPSGAKEQLENHLDIRWVFHKTTGNAQQDFMNINKTMAAIKNYKAFKPLNETGRKCIVDGKRNVKFYRKTDKETITTRKDGLLKKLYQPEDHVIIIEPDDEKPLKIWQLQKGEGVSAVTIKKRLFQNEPHQFPSTVGIALMHIFKELKNDEAFKAFKCKVQDGKGCKGKYFTHSNDQLFYKENIPILFKKEGKENDIDKAITNHEKWSKNTKLPFTKYYALLRFDGDKLGDWFSGKYLKSGKDFIEYQKTLSTCIIDFADTIKNEITKEKANGSVIYAGGEDFMVMANLHSLESVVSLIRKEFKEKISDKMQDWVTKEVGKSTREFTLSFGICIAHYKEPLQLVLDKTKKMEKLAKDSGRKRFAMQISKHSGSQITTMLPWKDDKSNHLFDRYYHIIKAILDKKISPAFLLNIYNFCEELNFDDHAKEVIKSKKKLFIERALLKDKEKTFDEINKSLDLFLNIEKETNKDIKKISIRDFAHLLLSIDFIQRHDYAK